MPIYEYRCRDCGESLEVQQSFSDDALTECPTCQGSLRKIFGNVGISFRGSGFYKNDHGSRAKGETKPAAAAADSSAAASSSSSDSSSSSSSSSSSDGGSTTKKESAAASA